MSAETRQKARKSVESVIARNTGTRSSQPMFLAGHKKHVQDAHDIMNLPSIVVPPCQDNDPGSSTFGEFFWMADYDPPL